MFLTETQVQELRQEYGSPVFVYSAGLLRQTAEQALAVPAPFGLTVRYAMKANPARAILQLFDRLGLHIDASSVFEVRRALLAGIEPDKILMTAQELPTTDLPDGIRVNASSIEQLQHLVAIGQRDIGLRVNPGIGSGHHAKTTVGGAYAGFGIWHEDLTQAAELCRRNQLRVTRLHFHIGSGADARLMLSAAARVLDFLPLFPQVTTLNIGGGFRVARTPDESADDIVNVLSGAFQKLAATMRSAGRLLHLEIEPGTYLVANAGVLLTRVLDIKRSGSNQFVVLDTGMTEIMRPSLYGAQHPLEIYPERSSEGLYTVIGHCCESGDVLTVRPSDQFEPRAVQLPTIKPGDTVLIGGIGAYCSSMSAKNYNSFPEAAEVLLGEDNHHRLIRRRQTMEQIIQNEL